MNKAHLSIDMVKRNLEDWSLSANEADSMDLAQTQQFIANKAAGFYLSGLQGFSGFNPHLPESNSQGLLECLHEVQQMCCAMTGLNAASLAALSSSQATFACLSMIKKYHQRKKQSRHKVLLCAELPEVINVARQAKLELNKVSLHQLEQSLDADVAAIIVEVPKLGSQEFLSDSVLAKIRQLDVLVYLEGSGQYFYPVKLMPKHFSVDLISLDLGYLCESEPGAYVVLSNESLKPYLPVPWVGQIDKQFQLQSHRQQPLSIGPLTIAAGNIDGILRCYVQLRLSGVDGIQQQALKALVSALYVCKKVSESGFEKNCSIIRSNGLCRITMNYVEPTIQSLLNQLEIYQATGFNFNGLRGTDENSYVMTFGRLHYLSRKQLDLVVDLIIKNL